MSANLKPKVKFVYAEKKYIYMDLKEIFAYHKKCKKKKEYCSDEDIN